MKHSYIIIDDDPNSVQNTKAIADRFPGLHFIGAAHTYESGLDLVLEHHPKLVFLEIDPLDPQSNLSLLLVNELYRYLKQVPTIIVTTKNKELAFEAIKYEIFDYFIKPIDISNFRKAILKFEKINAEEGTQSVPKIIETTVREQDLQLEVEEVPADLAEIVVAEPEQVPFVAETENTEEVTIVEQSTVTHPPKPEEKPLIICVKSYGDYRFIEAKDICYLQADNNSTDIHLYNGEMITAFKTLKHFESVLSSPFVRIHNSYIVNIDYVSRIHTGNSVCYIKNTTIKLPFSKSYKENVDSIINSITNGNYLEI